MLTFTIIGCSFLVVFLIFFTNINAEVLRNSIDYTKAIRFGDDSESFDTSGGRQDEMSEQNDDEETSSDPSDYAFSYRNSSEWGIYYPGCNGKRQSPIAMCSKGLKALKVSSPFTWKGYHERPSSMMLINDGHTVELNATWANKDAIPFISGGTLTGDYAFHQLHFHWDSVSGLGSEHTINGRRLPLEMHVMHYKKEYGSASEAMKHDDGIATVGIILEITKITRSQNKGVRTLQRYFKYVKNPHSEVQIKPFALSNFRLDFPGEYISYHGSLTVPPCSEIVTWILPTYSRHISQAQLDLFRTIKLEGGDNHNRRSAKKVNGRIVNYISY